MPVSALTGIAKKAGVSLEKAEKVWDEAKAIASKSYNEKDDKFYPIVMTITKKKLGLKESLLSFKDYINGR